MILWCLLGIIAGIIFGIIPGAGPFLAIATLYPLLALGDVVSIVTFYVCLLITSNYMNSIRYARGWWKGSCRPALDETGRNPCWPNQEPAHP